ncbi:uncharacterized protein LOC129928572 [Biomphalaria glabrata]|uniref:Uncharacterized protein LOC129928572 n=1 Tax=Biomphalaria glabrata TaxID=6526 RepID=A0A9W3BIE4_BIOGL|nr:uncharacterized protein LOC129928572 [Biomphalaria glabrata]
MEGIGTSDFTRKQILCDIRRNKYYGLMLDSTPDLAHREQLSEVIRFVDVNFKTKKVTIKESFLGFIQLHAKDAATLENVIVEQLQADNLPIADCRSQCYDNAAVMAAELSGLQQRIAIRNPQASFVNCNNHSLNLAGLHAAKQDPVVVTFFGTVEKIYVFFSASTVRWEKMKELLGITLKRECPTRWSARQDAVNAIHEQFDGFLQLLENLYEDGTQTSETQNDAYSLLQNLMSFNFITLLDFWHAVLSKIDRIQKRLQDPSMNFHDAALDLEGLQQRLSSIREDVCITAVNADKVLCEKLGIRIEGRIKRRKQMPGENAGDAGLAAVEEITRIMKSHCATLADFYKTDIDGTELFVEISDCMALQPMEGFGLPQHIPPKPFVATPEPQAVVDLLHIVNPSYLESDFGSPAFCFFAGPRLNERYFLLALSPEMVVGSVQAALRFEV